LINFYSIVILLSITASAFFSGLEIAFISSNKLYIELEKKENNFIGGILTKLTKNPSNFITTMLVGNNIALVVYGFYMGEFIMHYLTPYLANELLMFLLQTVISTLIILVTAEFLPKAIFRVYANETLKYFAFPAYIFYLLFYPISKAIMLISNFLLKVVFKVESEEVQSVFSSVELGKKLTLKFKYFKMP